MQFPTTLFLWGSVHVDFLGVLASRLNFSCHNLVNSDQPHECGPHLQTDLQVASMVSLNLFLLGSINGRGKQGMNI